MDYEAHKRKTLAHCLMLAESDPTYALWAARQYEDSMPWLLTNLVRVVQARIAKNRQSAPGADSPTSASGSAAA